VIARLGYGLYWIGCELSALFLLAIGFLITGYSTDPAGTIGAAVFLTIAAALSWLIGKGLRYILAGN